MLSENKQDILSMNCITLTLFKKKCIKQKTKMYAETQGQQRGHLSITVPPESGAQWGLCK